MDPTHGTPDPVRTPDARPALAAPPDPAPTRLRARTPSDIAAFVPLALGFVPERSVVMLSIGAPGMNARVDLPHDPDDVDDVVEALLRPVRRNGVREVVVVVYDDDTTVADEAAWSLHEELTAAGIEVREVLRVHDDHWYAVLPGAPLAAYQGVPFSLVDHAFTAQGVFDGRVTHASREALRATLAPDPTAAIAASDVVGAAVLPPGALAALVRRHVRGGSTLSRAELASVAATVVVPARRDEAWVWLGRAEARSACELWSDAVRRLHGSHVAGPAAVLAFCAWLVGDGALSWCAVDRCREAEPAHSLAGLVAQLLESATSPDEWESLRPSTGASGDPAA
ncbi:DUF4192 domain-containing protein [Nocardioides sp. S-58]|uniref:DUF4192 domain-containing protein n=1 Tax=Nocardioides renjunii TaxID=3095075 RepID=A0ABU5KAP7_9ACTN|nr:DUF4192 domain-containing protein [Nocardioides sp. S-58]MDZ5661927.1 DUF4192 domain-containing protein [Nocardioides sp. S-58]